MARTQVLGLDVAHDESAAVDHEDPGHRARGRLLGPVDTDRHLGVVLPTRDHAVLDAEAELGRDVTVETFEHGFEALPRRDRVLETHVRRQQVDERRELRVDHGVTPSPGGAGYLGCMRMPASMRIDSAFTYELASNSTASVANSSGRPSRCGKSTSWASLPLKVSEPSPAP